MESASKHSRNYLSLLPPSITHAIAAEPDVTTHPDSGTDVAPVSTTQSGKLVVLFFLIIPKMDLK
tara:strand:+ start:3450 stop:3644 length:195 start_codon:yes stop_codon:yes gene_type:complete